jgi:hypothetical protein
MTNYYYNVDWISRSSYNSSYLCVNRYSHFFSPIVKLDPNQIYESLSKPVFSKYEMLFELSSA